MDTSLNAVTVLLAGLAAAVASLGTMWLGWRKQRDAVKATAADLAATQAREQRELERRLREEHMASYTTQAELEQQFRSEIREDISRVKAEARHLEKLLQNSEEENRMLRRRVLELEMEIVRLRAEMGALHHPSQKPSMSASAHVQPQHAGPHGEATITLRAERTDDVVVDVEAVPEPSA